MDVFIGVAVGVSAVAVAGVLFVLVAARRRRRKFPPVVELAQTTTLPRLSFKIASFRARATAAPKPPAPDLPIPFITVSAPAPAPAPATAQVPAPAPAQVAVQAPDVQNGHLTQPAASAAPAAPAYVPPAAAAGRPIYESAKSPYAAPVVKGSRITLPDNDDELHIQFRPDPDASPLTIAGDAAETIEVTGPDGRIRIGGPPISEFGQF